MGDVLVSEVGLLGESFGFGGGGSFCSFILGFFLGIGFSGNRVDLDLFF